jgi:hypothetical protein
MTPDERGLVEDARLAKHTQCRAAVGVERDPAYRLGFEVQRMGALDVAVVARTVVAHDPLIGIELIAAPGPQGRSARPWHFSLYGYEFTRLPSVVGCGTASRPGNAQDDCHHCSQDGEGDQHGMVTRDATPITQTRLELFGTRQSPWISNGLHANGVCRTSVWPVLRNDPPNEIPNHAAAAGHKLPNESEYTLAVRPSDCDLDRLREALKTAGVAES